MQKVAQAWLIVTLTGAQSAFYLGLDSFVGEAPILLFTLIGGVVNTFVGFTTKLLTFPLIIVTLGLFILVINGLMLWLTSAVSGALGLGFEIAGFWSAFFGALVVTVVSTVLSLMVRPPRIVVRREL